MVISRQENHGDHLEVENCKFKRVRSFKYLGVTINSKNNNYKEIKIRTTAGNKCYYGLMNTLKSNIALIENYIIPDIY